MSNVTSRAFGASNNDTPMTMESYQTLRSRTIIHVVMATHALLLYVRVSQFWYVWCVCVCDHMSMSTLRQAEGAIRSTKSRWTNKYSNGFRRLQQSIGRMSWIGRRSNARHTSHSGV